MAINMKVNKKKYDFINPFIVAAVNIIRETTGLKVAKKNIFISRGRKSSYGTVLVLNIDKDLTGKVCFEFGRGMTIRLASRMIEKAMIEVRNPEEFKSLLESAIIELGNLISGKAITILEEKGYDCQITPPNIFFGKGITLVEKNAETIVIELRTLFGDFNINLSVFKSEKKTSPKKAKKKSKSLK